jgi:type II secretory pathway component PulM
MSQFLDKLNLRPQEKRLVVLGSAVLFLVLNFWFVWPHASDLSKVRLRLEQGRRELMKFQTELSRTNEYALRLQELRGEAAGVLAPGEQVTALTLQIQSQASKSGVSFGAVSTPRSTRSIGPAEFFEEQSINLGINPTGPAELLDFLVALASSDFMIRVKELELKPDPSQTKLMGSMRLVASFQRTSPETGATGRKS